jgi:hypothetical protein
LAESLEADNVDVTWAATDDSCDFSDRSETMVDDNDDDDEGSILQSYISP